MPAIDLSILNQRQTPAFYASSLATRPAFGFAGRIFIDTDSPSTGLYRDTGAAWVQIADPGAGTTGTLQQVTTNGNTTTVGIISNTVSLPLWNTVNSNSPYYFGGSAASDNFRIFSAIGATLDQTEMVFQVGDNGQPYSTGGERFRFNYDNSGGGTGAKDVFIVDYDLSYFNTSLGINTDTPTSALDVHSGVNVISQLNQTVATNNSLLAFQNAGSGLWRVGNFYNAGANDFGVFDVIGAIQPVTIKKTTGQVLIGTSTVGSGKLVVASTTGDNGIQIVGATAPSLRIDSSESGPTKRAGLGISTATNNFIQGSADRDFCIFNGSTAAASPILFGIYDAGAVNVQEAARISPARNFLIGTTTDAGFKLAVNGAINAVGTISSQPTSNANGLVVVNGSSGSYGGNVTFQRGGTQDGVIGTQAANNTIITGATNADICILADGGGRSIRFSTSSASPQFTLNSSGQGIFSGRVTAGSSMLLGEIQSTYSVIETTSSNGIWLRPGGISSPGGLYATTTGNILINTTTDAGEKLQVAGQAAFTNTDIQLNLVYSGSTKTTFRCDSAGGLLVNTASGYIINYIGGIERLRIKTNTINISNIPTSSAGLSSGDLYSVAGVINIVP